MFISESVEAEEESEEKVEAKSRKHAEQLVESRTDTHAHRDKAREENRSRARNVLSGRGARKVESARIWSLATNDGHLCH